MPDGRTKKRADEGNDCCPQKGVEQDVEAGNQARMAEVVGVNQNKYNKADSHTGPGKVFDGVEMRLNYCAIIAAARQTRNVSAKKCLLLIAIELRAQAEVLPAPQYLSSPLFTDCLIMRNHASRILGSAVP